MRSGAGALRGRPRARHALRTEDAAPRGRGLRPGAAALPGLAVPRVPAGAALARALPGTGATGAEACPVRCRDRLSFLLF